MLRTRFMTLIAGTAILILPCCAQTEKETYRQEISAQGFGSFVKGTTQDGITNKASDSAGVLASYRYFFSAHQGIEADYGYTSNTQRYLFSSRLLGVKSYSHEFSAAYVFRVPLRKLTPFALAGAGALVFVPGNIAGPDTQARAAFVYGGGADFNLLPRFFVRMEYRGLVYNSPTYSLPALSGVDRVTHRAEPSIGIGYRF